MSRWVSLNLVVVLVACATTRRTPSALRGLTVAEQAAAFRDSTHGFCTSSSHGTAHGDSARRLLSAACWAGEDGNAALAKRYLEAALQFGGIPHSPATLREVDAAMQLFGYSPQQRLTQLTAGAQRWPAERWIWERQASVFDQLGRARDAAAARAKASTLPPANPTR